MDLFEAIVNRRTTNTAFLPKKITREHIRQLIKSASYAPSHFNSQPWRFIIIIDEELISKIGKIAGISMEELINKGTFWKKYRKYFRFSAKEMEEKKNGIHIDHLPAVLKPFVKYIFTEKGGRIISKFKIGKIMGKDEESLVSSSPLLFAILLDKEEYIEGQLSGLYSLISMGTVIQNLWLATTALGIGMQFVSTPGEVKEQWKEIIRLLEIPVKEYELLAIFRMGYINKNTKRPVIDWNSSQRMGIEKLANLNKWGLPISFGEGKACPAVTDSSGRGEVVRLNKKLISNNFA